MVVDCVCAIAVWHELAVYVAEPLWEKVCFSRRTSGNAGRVAIRIVGRRYAHEKGVGNVMYVGAGRNRVVVDLVSTGGGQGASCVALAGFVGVCETPPW